MFSFAAPMRTFVTLLVLSAGATAAQIPAPAPADRFVTVNGLRIHYLDWGSAGRQPLLLIHGLDRTAHTFDHLAPRFTSRYHVIAIEMRGHGDSGWDPEARYRVEDHARDVEGFVAQLGLRNLVIWGNSTGGRVAQVYAGMHPSLVSAVIAEDVGPERPRQIADAYAQRVKREDSGWASEEELVSQLLKNNPRMTEAQIRTWARSGTRRREGGRIVWKRDPQLAKGFVATDLWRFVERIQAPLLYVLGGASSIVSTDTQAELRRRVPHARIVTMPGLGHYPSDEQPEEFARIVDDFLRGQ